MTASVVFARSYDHFTSLNYGLVGSKFAKESNTHILSLHSNQKISLLQYIFRGTLCIVIIIKVANVTTLRRQISYDDTPSITLLTGHFDICEIIQVFDILKAKSKDMSLPKIRAWKMNLYTILTLHQFS